MDARIKLLLLLAFLLFLALLPKPAVLQLAVCFAYLLITLAVARLPWLRILRSSLVVIPFVGFFALIIYLSGDLPRAAIILSKSYLSALAVIVCVASTPLPQLVQAARWLHIPVFLVDITQLIYRYLFVLSGEFQVMRIAFSARGGQTGPRAFQSATGMVALLFGRAYERAGAVHSAMLSRGFSGLMPAAPQRQLQRWDLVFGFLGLLLVVLVRFI